MVTNPYDCHHNYYGDHFKESYSPWDDQHPKDGHHPLKGLALIGPLCPHLPTFCSIWPHFTLVVMIWPFLALFCLIWHFWPNRTHLAPFGQVWPSVTHCGHVLLCWTQVAPVWPFSP